MDGGRASTSLKAAQRLLREAPEVHGPKRLDHLHVHPPSTSIDTLMTLLTAPLDVPFAFEALSRPRVFTNGVFDLLHRGHCQLLEQARALGGSLTVAINSDASARRLDKGRGRPVNRATDRAAVVAALRAVDLVLLFDEDTPCEWLERLRPEAYVKGGDYDMAALRETRLMARWGGRVQALAFEPGLSTSGIVERIVVAHGTPSPLALAGADA
jgi:D-glycero-beta-D-manno-heptose 1-phosphate adenylyltransferase